MERGGREGGGEGAFYPAQLPQVPLALLRLVVLDLSDCRRRCLFAGHVIHLHLDLCAVCRELWRMSRAIHLGKTSGMLLELFVPRPAHVPVAGVDGVDG
jgi:hypothetical protein